MLKQVDKHRYIQDEEGKVKRLSYEQLAALLLIAEKLDNINTNLTNDL